MNVLLQKHGAKHIYKVPEGLRELCADIAREVCPMKLLFGYLPPSSQRTIKLFDP